MFFATGIGFARWCVYAFCAFFGADSSSCEGMWMNMTITRRACASTRFRTPRERWLGDGRRCELGLWWVSFCTAHVDTQGRARTARGGAAATTTMEPGVMKERSADVHLNAMMAPSMPGLSDLERIGTRRPHGNHRESIHPVFASKVS